MIKINSINGSPEYLPESYFGSHFDGEYFYFFNSEEEHKEYLDSLPKYIEPTQQTIGPALQAVLSATPEEIEQIKQILGIK